MPLALAFPVTAQAHCEVGERTFVSTITFDDPCISDELSLPTIQSFKNGDEPSAQELDISGEYTKTITRNFGISFEEAWVHLDVPGEGSHTGFDNVKQFCAGTEPGEGRLEACMKAHVADASDACKVAMTNAAAGEN
jgi:hypothetical protein